MSAAESTIILNADRDNVAIAIRDLEAGDGIAGIEAREHIPRFHKVALRKIDAGNKVFKYGEIIGIAAEDIPAGAWVHTHNLDMHGTPVDAEQMPGLNTPPEPESISGRYFLGFPAVSDVLGRFGTRNYLLIASTVDCSGRTVELAVEELNRRKEHFTMRFPNVDGIVGLTHNSGCGLVALSRAHLRENLTLNNLVSHPNVGGRVVVQLGCEKSQADLVFGADRLASIHHEDADDPQKIPFVTIQEQSGTWDTVDRIVNFVERYLLPRANRRRRELVPANELILALQCGGSNAASGLTVNPAIGHAADLLVRCGGTPFISETTETIGAEHLLARRAKTPEIASKYLTFVKEYAAYIERGDGKPQSNLSHGNMTGGLTTIAEKSLGAIAKGGTTALCWVNDYAERIMETGFGFMNGPSYDPPSATGQTAGGAQVGVFSTGAGSCFGGLLIPWIKVVSNTPVYEKIEDMEINAGRITDGKATMEEIGTQIFEMVLAVASGARTYSEKLGYSVVNIWHSGAVT
jgi:altronate hydrolase